MKIHGYEHKKAVAECVYCPAVLLYQLRSILPEESLKAASIARDKQERYATIGDRSLYKQLMRKQQELFWLYFF